MLVLYPHIFYSDSLTICLLFSVLSPHLTLVTWLAFFIKIPYPSPSLQEQNPFSFHPICMNKFLCSRFSVYSFISLSCRLYSIHYTKTIFLNIIFTKIIDIAPCIMLYHSISKHNFALQYILFLINRIFRILVNCISSIKNVAFPFSS